MIPEEAWELVPEGYPSDLPPWIEPAVEQANLNELQGQAYAWSDHMLRFSRNALFALVYGGLVEDVTAGFIRFGWEGDERASLLKSTWKGSPPFRKIMSSKGEPWSFGVVVGLRPFSRILGWRLAPILGWRPAPIVDWRPAPIVPSLSILDSGMGITFPIIFEFRRIRYHAPHPVGNATSTCYVRARSDKIYYCGMAWTEGVLVARHVLANVGAAYVGAAVTMDTVPRSTMTVVDIDPDSTNIDAAILDRGGNLIPATARLLKIVSAVAPGQNVTIHGRMNTFSAQILTVSGHPTYYGRMVTHRAFTDASGIVGDSGALADLSNGDTVGLYMGEISPPKEGVLQLMNQVSKYFGLDPYN